MSDIEIQYHTSGGASEWGDAVVLCSLFLLNFHSSCSVTCPGTVLKVNLSEDGICDSDESFICGVRLGLDLCL